MPILQGNRSLKEHLAVTWIISGGLAVLTCAIAFAIMGWIDYRNIQDRLADELKEKSITVSRRLSGELLLGTSGAAASVANNLKGELALGGIEIKAGSPCATVSPDEEYCLQQSTGELSILRPIPHIQQPTYVIVSKALPPFFTIARFSLFFLSVIPIALVLGFALALQRYFIGRYVLKPIASLVDTSTGVQSPQAHWPKEIKDMAKRLATSFEGREQAVYGQIARGVIHDIRTLLHSVLSATQLVKEQEADTQKRQMRLETLFRASDSNLPKINDLINLTLDGSREIPINQKRCDITATIRNAVKTNESLSSAKNIAIRFGEFPEQLLVAHDPIQLERVFTNLIKNGIEACAEKNQKHPNGAVSISAKIDSNRKNIAISIEDSGCGLPDRPEQVFRLLKSTKIHGSGLGLVVSRKIVQAHGGDLVPDHARELGGARFEVRLPISDLGAGV